MQDWKNKKVTVLGLGRSGIATANYLAANGARVFLSDSAEATDERKSQAATLEKQGIKVELGGHTTDAITFGDFIVTSPGIKPNADVITRAKSLNIEVICDIELAYRETRVPIIAITGTNGKSTTTALISWILEKSGHRAPACGNFGRPIMDMLKDKPDFLIVEMSSYQLHYCKNLAPHIGVWMNLTPDHLDWHGGLEPYIEAKQKLFANQRPDQYAVLNMDDPIVSQVPTRSEIFPFSAGTDLNYCIQAAFMRDHFLAYRIGGRGRIVCDKNELQIIGQHNLENALAAISVCALLRISPEDIESYLKEFKALEHRLEFVATVNDVSYYNDSKATNPESTIKALEAFPDQKVVLIAGGRDKGTSLSDFVHSVRKNAAAVILIGEAKERFDWALREVGVENIYPVNSLNEAVTLGEQLKLGPVLLSPACASFDMFKDFEDRGRVFKDIVRARLEKVAPSA
ncbi:MAG TPA: UDP-N-acetylmuramoyl-L-alanine--D-glutamate ligase [Trichormus sp.]|jgi:UDP-N-acetylmuramoylalanine--D-glutamate ligase